MLLNSNNPRQIWICRGFIYSFFISMLCKN
nr:MAG TPA: hypothetical protein [Caudoviricetes sp.]